MSPAKYFKPLSRPSLEIRPQLPVLCFFFVLGAAVALLLFAFCGLCFERPTRSHLRASWASAQLDVKGAKRGSLPKSRPRLLAFSLNTVEGERLRQGCSICFAWSQEVSGSAEQSREWTR